MECMITLSRLCGQNILTLEMIMKRRIQEKVERFDTNNNAPCCENHDTHFRVVINSRY